MSRRFVIVVITSDESIDNDDFRNIIELESSNIEVVSVTSVHPHKTTNYKGHEEEYLK